MGTLISLMMHVGHVVRGLLTLRQKTLMAYALPPTGYRGRGSARKCKLFEGEASATRCEWNMSGSVKDRSVQLLPQQNMQQSLGDQRCAYHSQQSQQQHAVSLQSSMG